MTDFRSSMRARRQRWFGLKRYVKEAASYPLPHAGVKLASRFVPKLREGRLPAPRSLKEVVGRVDGATFVMLSPDRCEIAKELYWGGGKRPRPEDANALELMARLAREADVFIDIGAYTGVFTLATAAMNPDLIAHAFEIVPGVADLLEANLRRNQIEGRATVHREGIGVPGATMTVPSGEGGSALPSFYSSRMRFDEGVSVPFVSLDSLADSIPNDKRVLMKIDVEGTEADIFANGGSFLERYKPDILCEVLDGQADAAAVNAVLQPLGYGFYLVRERDTVRYPSIQPSPRFRDWLFTLREPGSLGTTSA